MAFDKPTYLIFSVAVMCLILTVIAVHAKADDKTMPQILNVSIPDAQNDQYNPIELLIKEQLTAIKARNAELAFSYFSDDFHEKYESAKKFLSDIRFEYRPIYNYEQYEFLEQHELENGFIQKVSFKDAYTDEEFMAIYRLTQTPDGQLKIDSFAVLELDSNPI